MDWTRLTRTDIVVALLALGSAASTLFPWTTRFRGSEIGLAYPEGWATLVAAASVLACFATYAIGRSSESIRRAEHVGVTLLAAAPILLYIRVVGDTDPIANSLIDFFNRPAINVGGGLRLALTCGIGAMAVRLAAEALAWRDRASVVRERGA